MVGDSKHEIIDLDLGSKAVLHRFNNMGGYPYSAIYVDDAEEWNTPRENEAKMIEAWREKASREKAWREDDNVYAQAIPMGEVLLTSFRPGSKHYDAVEAVQVYLDSWLMSAEHEDYWGCVESRLEKETGVKGIGMVLDGRKKHIEIDWLVRLALALNVTPNDLLGFSTKERAR